jgi:hypothetical protein
MVRVLPGGRGSEDGRALWLLFAQLLLSQFLHLSQEGEFVVGQFFVVHQL